MRGSGPLRGNRDFRRYWIGQAVSDLGSQISVIAYPLLVLGLGGSPAQAGAVVSCSLITRTVCRLLAGALADACDRRLIMVAADVIRAAAVGSVVLAGALGSLAYPQLLIVAVVEGCATAAFGPAAAITVSHIVPPDELTEALARSHSREAAAWLLGPVVGGWLYTVRRVLPFGFDAVSYLISACLIARIGASLRPPERADPGDRRILAGIGWLARRPTLRNALVYAGVVNLVGTATVLAMIVTLRTRGTSSTVIGLVLACVGIGAVLGAAVANRIIRRVTPAALFLGIGVIWAAVLSVFVVATAPWVVGPLLAAMFLLAPAGGITVGKVILTRTPEELRGRITTAAELLMYGVPALGPALTGLMLGAFGVSHTWLVLALVTAAAALVCAPMFRSPDFLATDTRSQEPPEPADVPVGQPVPGGQR